MARGSGRWGVTGRGPCIINHICGQSQRLDGRRSMQGSLGEGSNDGTRPGVDR